MEPEAWIDRLQRLATRRVVLLVGDHVLPAGQCHRNGMGMIGQGMAEITCLPSRILEQIAWTHASDSKAC